MSWALEAATAPRKPLHRGLRKPPAALPFDLQQSSRVAEKRQRLRLTSQGASETSTAGLRPQVKDPVDPGGSARPLQLVCSVQHSFGARPPLPPPSPGPRRRTPQTTHAVTPERRASGRHHGGTARTRRVGTLVHTKEGDRAEGWERGYLPRPVSGAACCSSGAMATGRRSSHCLPQGFHLTRRSQTPCRSSPRSMPASC